MGPNSARREWVVSAGLALGLHVAVLGALIAWNVGVPHAPAAKRKPTRISYVAKPPVPAKVAEPVVEAPAEAKPTFVISSPALDPPHDDPNEPSEDETGGEPVAVAEVADTSPEPVNRGGQLLGDYGDIAYAREAEAVGGAGSGDAGVAEEAPTDVVLPFGEGMTPPDCDRSAGPIAYPPEAREARVTGTMLLKCHIFTDGSVRNCRVVKDLPFMADVVLPAVARWHCTPARFQGQPVNVDMTVPIEVRR